jgi:Tfp pilus assembly protein PilN
VRPVNLIPPEERRGERGPARTGPLSYVIVVALAAALVAITAVVLTNNQLSDRKAEKASLEGQVAQAKAEASRLSSFAQFATLQQAREQTVTTLAQSRFDWERVLRELAIVIPDDVWLTNVTATVTPEVQLEHSVGVEARADVSGPALEIQGCGASHVAVATFLADLEDIDGVTRVTVTQSDRPENQSAESAAPESTTAASAGGDTDCRTRDFISQFQAVAAFDEVQVAATSPTVTPPATAQPAASGAPASAADQSQVSDGQQQLEQQKQSSAQQTQKARKDVGTFVPGTGTAP